MRNGLLWVYIVLSVFSVIGCRSSDKRNSEAATLKATPAETQAVDELECSKRPEEVACCQALTPACNDCAMKAKAAREAWERKCLKPTVEPSECDGTPPVIACCNEPTDECRECRTAALNRLLAWKAACGDMEAYGCDQRPPQAACCQAMIPSCEACKVRNRRIAQEWERRCRASRDP